MKNTSPQSKSGLYLSPESEVALVLWGQSYFPSKVLKSKAQLTRH